jgi:hypothetical protein
MYSPGWKELKSWKIYHNHMEKEKVYLAFISFISVGLGLFLLGTMQVYAQPLVKDTPIGNLTGGDISISPEELLPANGTVSISTQGATDTDMEAFPPEGVTVIISSDTVTVTNQAVDIGGDEEQSDEDEGDDGGGINGDEDEQGGGEEFGGAEPAE